MAEYTIECTPHINDTHRWRFDSEEDAASAAKDIAETHKVRVDVRKTIRSFVVKVVEEVEI